MESYPRITIVTPSYNQGKYIRTTVDSILSQQYPNLEYIIMDGGSTDDTLSILKEYPSIKVTSERDKGQWDAINKGFQIATGDIWAYVNSDDTLLPGSLARIAREINPSSGRHIVMGRCQFTDQDGNNLEYEHPSAFSNHIRVLEIWKGHTIPQPAVFWTPEVWRTCGGMNGNLTSSWLDYDLFCRFSQKYPFYTIDQVLATYRLHFESKTSAKTEEERLDESIQISRQYWGPICMPKHLRLSLSLTWYRLDLSGKARKLHELGLTARPPAALFFNLAAAVLAPRAAFFTAIFPKLKRSAKGPFLNLLNRLVRPQPPLPQTRVHLNRTSVWNDGWAGPCLIMNLMAQGGENELEVTGWIDTTFFNNRPNFTVTMDGQKIGSHPVQQENNFSISFFIASPIEPGIHSIKLQCNEWFVSDQFKHNQDYRPLSWKQVSPNSIRFCFQKDVT
jgi:glycosyltransferase involved in cell wall biosynthesis